MFIGGETGSGKTTVRQLYADRYPRQLTEEETVIPVLSTTLPAKATVKGTATKLLASLGDPAANRGLIDAMTLRLVNLMKDCQVKLILLDELNHLIDRDSAKLLKLVAEELKELLIESDIPIVAFGLPTANLVLASEVNPQLSRRFVRRLYLSPFNWSNSNGEELRKFLFLVESKLPLIEQSCLAEKSMARRFYYATDGSVAHIMTLIRYSTRLALKQKQERLNLDILASVFETYRKVDKQLKEHNPFVVDNFQLEEVDGEFKAQASLGSHHLSATNKRIKARKASANASHVLQ